MFLQVRLDLGAREHIAGRLGIFTIGDTQISNRIVVEPDGRGLHSGIRKHRQQNRHAALHQRAKYVA